VSGNRPEIVSLLRLTAVMTILCIIVVLAAARFKGIPLIGVLPGDFEINLPGINLYLPLATSALFALIMTLIAVLVHDSTNHHDQS
jgi:K+-transporting ATPase A subunit